MVDNFQNLDQKGVKWELRPGEKREIQAQGLGRGR